MKTPSRNHRGTKHKLTMAIVTASVVAVAGHVLLASRAAQNPAADLNSDGKVDTLDLSILLTNWNKSGADLKGDINVDVTVNINDLSILLSSWGPIAATGSAALVFDFDELAPFTGSQSQRAFKYDSAPCGNNAQYASIVNDPAGVIDGKTGTVRKVIKMTTPNTAGGGTDSGARCQLETGPVLQEGGKYWEALAWYFPSDTPKQGAPPTWHVLHGAFGTNSVGNSPFRIDMINGATNSDGTLGREIHIGRRDIYNGEELWELKVGGVRKSQWDLRSRWIDVVLHYQIGRDTTGWLEIWINVGNGWERQKFSPTTAYHTTTADGYRVYYATADPLTSGEPPYDTRISNYYAYNSYLNYGFPDPNTGPTIYHGTHRIGSSFSAVSGSWSHANQTSAPSQ
jgi:hypothetical protein